MLAGITKSVVGLVLQYDMRARQNSPQALVFQVGAMRLVSKLSVTTYAANRCDRRLGERGN